MDNHIINKTQQELRQHFMTLLDSLSGLQSLASIDNITTNENEIFLSALSSLIKNQDLERCSIFLLEDNILKCQTGMDWKQHADLDHTKRSFKPHTFKCGEGIIGKCAESGKVIFCNNCALDNRFATREDNTITGSLICTPIFTDRKVIGVLNVSHPDTDFFHPWHASILQLFCTMLGKMLGYQRLFQGMEDEIQNRTNDLQQALSLTEELKTRYKKLSIIDDLTQLNNRRYFFPEASTEISRAIRNNEPYSLLLMDIDLFKKVNDNYGHSIGDRVLIGIANTLMELTRDGDILARFGGEEFVLVLPNTNSEGARIMAERIRERVKKINWQCEERRINISLSLGLTSLKHSKPAKNTSGLLDILLKEADLALYQAKDEGRDRVCVYQD